MKVETYACDQCKTHRKDANHWFKGYKLAQGKGVMVIEWEATSLLSDEDVDDEAHLCGASCVSQWVSQNLL